MSNNFKLNMPFSVNKPRITAIGIILLMIASTFAVGGAIAKTYTAEPPRPTGTYVATSPLLLGVGQQVEIDIYVWPGPSNPTYYAQTLVNGENGFNNISCTITAPDGTKSTSMPTDASLAHAGINVPGLTTIVGALIFYYTPTQVGNYSVTASFPGQTFTTDAQSANLNLSVYYEPSATTQAATFQVQSSNVLGGVLNGYPWSPLPTGYWTTPVSVNNREWSAISGDWLQPMYDAWCTDYNPYSTAPTTPHILWANQIQTGGLVGGVWGSLGYNGVQNAWTKGPMIYDGFLIQNDLIGGTYSCWNLYTGQLMWRNTGVATFCQRVNPAYQTAAQANEGGILGWIWDLTGTLGSWKRIDPYTGATLQTITNVPYTQGVVNVAGNVPGQANVLPTNVGDGAMEDGNPIVFVTQFGGWNTTIPLKYAYEYLIKWNYSALVPNLSGTVSSTNWLSGVIWNVSLRLPDGEGIGDGRGTITKIPYDGAGVVVVRAHDDEQIMEGIDENTGRLLWVNNNTVLDIGVGLSPAGPNGPYIMIDGSTAQFVAYSVTTGKEIWRATCGNSPWAPIPDMTYIFNNNTFYYGSYDGHVYAVNLQTGAPVWTSDWSGPSTENVYNTYPFNGASLGADGILYFSTYSTYANNPRPRFMELIAINQTNGHFLWTLPIGINPEALAYGILVGRGGQDGMEYALGQGPTATTVQAQQQIGGGMLIQGTVMDKSPGRSTTYGGGGIIVPTPAVSDASMSEWMTYLYGQNASMINSPPTDITGVPVTLTAVDPSGNFVTIGTTTSNAQGHFGFQWTPTTAGLYTIYATFSGSGSYYASSASASATVASAVSPTTAPTASPPASQASSTDYTWTIVGSAIAVIIAVAIVGILVLRKKP